MIPRGITVVMLIFLVNTLCFTIANNDEIDDNDNGDDSGEDYETKSCGCGKWGSWTEYTACSEQCGGGLQGRSRARVCSANIVQTLHRVLNCVRNYTQFRECNTLPCGCESICSQWSSWKNEACSRRCGGGQLSSVRRRFCLGSQGCPEFGTKSLPCNTISCSECSCESWQPWSSYGQCSQTCGYGVQTRQRQRICQAPSADQDCINKTIELSTTPCNYGVCCSDVCTPWSLWRKGRCSVTCDKGSLTKVRSRLCALDICSDRESAVEGCKYETCSSTCKSTCSPWINQIATPCSASCGGGVRYIKSHRDCNYPDCQSEDVIITECNKERCRNTSCNGSCSSWSEWSDSVCSSSCDEGTSTSVRNRSCDIDGCEVQDVKQNTCKAKTCKATCNTACSSWSPWKDSACSATCDEGFVSSVRNRTCKQDDCKTNETITSPCIVTTCEVTCNDLCKPWSSWTSVGECSMRCGGGYRDEERIRKCHTKGPVCNIIETRKQKCNEEACKGRVENIGIKCPFLNGYLPDATDCTKFYQCVWGKAFQLTCPRGTGWDSSKSTCNFKYNIPHCR